MEMVDEFSDAQVQALHAHEFEMARKLESKRSLFNEDNVKVSKLVDFIRPLTGKSLAEIVTAINTPSATWQPPNPDAEEEDIDFLLAWTFEFWLFTPITLYASDPSFSSTYDLKNAIADALPKSTPPSQALSSLLSDDFCEKSLTRKGGFKIEPTNDLTLHLTFVPDEHRMLYIFHNAKLLEHLSRPHNPDSTLFPDEFLSETLKTYYLVFDRTIIRNNRRIQRHSLRRWQLDVDVEARVSRHARLDLDQYPYYRERLLEIQKRYNNSKPITLKQLWFDDRSPAERTTVIVGLIVFFLTVVWGLIQSITGILQVIK